MGERIITTANLSCIENNLEAINDRVDFVSRVVANTSKNVESIEDELSALAEEFRQYVMLADMQHEHSIAETRLVQIRQELDEKFSAHNEVRSTITGILQANDLSIVRKQTITYLTEELMIITPKYWLTPCLIALAAWINDDRDLAFRALNEGIRRDDEKTSLLFALVCRRSGRNDACLKWIERYFSTQDPEDLDRKCMIMIDAYACGILAVDSSGLISKRINTWMEELSEKPGFTERQVEQWKEAILLKRVPKKLNYKYLSKYSPTWQELEDVMTGAFLHVAVLSYFENIFAQNAAGGALDVQIDEILKSLVTDYDDEEIPLRMDEKLNSLIVELRGDVRLAGKHMDIEKTAFAVHKSLTQLLTDAAMKPDTSHSSVTTRKFAVALSRDWIVEAYRDIVAENRMKIPTTIKIEIEGFMDSTTDGRNEQELADRMNELLDFEKEETLSRIKMTAVQQYSLFGGIALCGAALAQFWLLIPGIGAIIYHFTSKKDIEAKRADFEQKFETRRKESLALLRALLAEVVDFRAEFAERDRVSNKVIDFLKQLSPEQYVKNIVGSTRKIVTS